MDVVPYLSAVILISTIATIFLAVLSYAAFKLRDKRRPKAKKGAPSRSTSIAIAAAPRAKTRAAEGDPEAPA